MTNMPKKFTVIVPFFITTLLDCDFQCHSIIVFTIRIFTVTKPKCIESNFFQLQTVATRSGRSSHRVPPSARMKLGTESADASVRTRRHRTEDQTAPDWVRIGNRSRAMVQPRVKPAIHLPSATTSLHNLCFQINSTKFTININHLTHLSNLPYQ